MVRMVVAGWVLGTGCVVEPEWIPVPDAEIQAVEADGVESAGDLPPPAPLPVAPRPRPQALMGLAAALPDVAESAVQSVVSVGTRRAMRRDNPFVPGRPMPEQQGIGSGVIIREDGIVVTNHHVVEGATEVAVSLVGGDLRGARILGTDPRSDLAVLQIVDPPSTLRALPFGDSDTLRLGEVVLAVGTPFGIGQTVTMGIVSAKGRSDVGIVDYEDFIQTDAAINPGNSGGALVDLDGTLVGINTAIFSKSGGSQGIGFAIPSSMASSIVQQILEQGEVRRGFLGVEIRDLRPGEAAPLGVDGGTLVTRVQSGSPADAAGLKAGDVVIKFQGSPVDGATDFRHQVAQSGANADFRAVVHRKGAVVVIEGRLGRLGPR